MLNVAVLQGRLTADPELRQTPQGISVCRFSIAVDRSYSKSGAEKQTDFIDITVWRQTAEFVCKYFQKGSAVLVEGRIQTGSYVDKETGKNRRTFEVVANNVHFGESKSASQNKGGAPYARSAAEAPAAFSAGAAEDFAVIDEGDEDLPF
ncbi:MAG: single-stranded DNA-binding protein [Oscillospiraceae bacterium]|nr:single-stranded DNA-binding protein [Oscillospiraceae bacterium]